jgi:hypothetical protein
MRRTAFLAIAPLIPLLLPAWAGAGTVSEKVSSSDPYFTYTSVVYVAKDGEANQLKAAWSENRSVVTLTDAGASITIAPGTACTAVDDHTVKCRGLPPEPDTERHFSDVTVRLGDRSDTFRGASTELGSTLTEFVTGGPGTDHLKGGNGDDTFYDGGPAGEADVYEGGDDESGGGFDIVTYAGRSAALTITPDTLEDETKGIDVLEGGDAGDTMTGGDGLQSYGGGEGDDVLSGNGGSDRLTGGPGDDRLDGGAGRDNLYPDAGRDRLSCGADADNVVDAVAGLFIPADCEVYRQSTPSYPFYSVKLIPYPLKVTRTTATFEIGCPHEATADFEPEPCRGKLTLTAGGDELGARAFKGDYNEGPVKVRVRLTAAGRRAAKAGTRVRARLSGSAALKRGDWRFRLAR